MSLGGGASTTLKNAVDYAWKSGGANGSVIVAAAGNDGDATLNYPAAYPNVVSVAATDDTDARASFSNANADVEIAAPGVDILSTWNNGAYNTISGTSMATPHVAGVGRGDPDEEPRADGRSGRVRSSTRRLMTWAPRAATRPSASAGSTWRRPRLRNSAQDCARVAQAARASIPA